MRILIESLSLRVARVWAYWIVGIWDQRADRITMDERRKSEDKYGLITKCPVCGLHAPFPCWCLFRMAFQEVVTLACNLWKNALSASVCLFLFILVFSLLRFCYPAVLTLPLSSQCLSAFTHLYFAVLLSLLLIPRTSWPLFSCIFPALVWSKYSVTCEYWMCSVKYIITVWCHFEMRDA